MNNTLSNTELARIEEDMKVIDSNGDKVGTVEFVRFGDEDHGQPGPETNEVFYAENGEDTFIDIIAQVFDPVDVPEELQQRMYRHGFLKVETGLFRSDRYALLDNVAHITNDEVHLNITKDDLFHLD